MKHILDAIPEIGKILDNLISTPEEKREAELKLKEIDIREVEARLGVQKAWLSNQSLFVAGAIPTILWMVSLVVFFNCIVAPLLSPWVEIRILSLPDWYASLAGTVVIGLFGKKAFENTEIQWHGETVKPSRKRVEADLEGEKKPEVAAPVVEASPTSAHVQAAARKREYTAEEVEARLAEMYRERGIEW